MSPLLHRLFLRFGLLLLALVPAVYGTGQTLPLDKKVTLHYIDAPLEEVLTTLRQQYAIPISYANNQLPLQQKVTVRAQGKSLKPVLDELLRNSGIGYRQVGNQLVLVNAGQSGSQAALRTANSEAQKAAAAGSPAGPVANSLALSRGNSQPGKTTAAAAAASPAAEASKSGSRKSGTGASQKAGAKATAQPAKVKPAGHAQTASHKPAPTPSKAGAPRQPVPGETGLAARQPESGSGAAAVPGTVGAQASGAAARQTGEPALAPGKGAKESTPAGMRAGAGAQASADSAAAAARQPAPTAATDSVALASATPEPAAESTGQVFEERVWQVSLVPFLGRNGKASGSYVNKTSLNVLGGYAGALNGVEVGSIFNVEKDYVKGVQIAGVANAAGGRVAGAQIGGVLNAVRRGVKGAQVAGVLNVAGGKVEGTQVAGVLNVAGKGVSGAQAAGVLNVAGGTVSGLQLGFLNICDTLNGTSIGFLSIARHGGYRKLELWANESSFLNLGLKLGSQRFYNIFLVSVQKPFGKMRWSWGYGAGTRLTSQGSNTRLNLELTAQHINEGRTVTEYTNLLSQLRLLVARPLSTKAAYSPELVVGPSLNVLVARFPAEVSGLEGPGIAPLKLYDGLHGSNTTIRGWLGVSLGLRF